MTQQLLGDTKFFLQRLLPYFCLFCYRSAEWKNLDDDQKENLGIKVDDDGKFWLANV